MPGEQRYGGHLAATRRESVHYRCRCGRLMTIKVVRAVDVARDEDLCRRAIETSLDKGLNVVQCAACEHRDRVHVSLTYHDGAERVLALVLPESQRHVELEARMALLDELRHETEVDLPDYVMSFDVVYGPTGLATLLERRRAESLSRARDQQRRGDLEKRLHEARERERQLNEKQLELERVTQELDKRSGRVTELELSLKDRKGALDRRTAELERRHAELEEFERRVRAESQGELPMPSGDTEVVDANDVLSSAPAPAKAMVPAAQPHAALADEAETRVSSTPSRPPPRFDDSDLEDILTGAGPEQNNLRELLADGVQLDDGSDALSGSPEPITAPLPPVAEVGDDEITKPAPPDPEIEAWIFSKREALKLISDDHVRLLARVDGEALEELLASDIRALLQLHRMERYPLVTLTLARAATLSGGTGQPFSFHFDVAKDADRRALEILGRDFRFQLEIYDQEYLPVRQRRLSAPLSSNVRYVIAAADDWLKQIAPHLRSMERARASFALPGYDRLGRRHALAREFRDSVLDRLQQPVDLLRALQLCNTFSEPGGEEYLIQMRSYPLDRWNERRLRVLQRALEQGLWMGSVLARIAVSENLARSKKDLVLHLQRNFARFAADASSSLGESRLKANWEALEREAHALGLGQPTEPVHSDSKPVASGVIAGPTLHHVEAPTTRLLGQELLYKQLDDPEGRLQAIIELCQPSESIPSIERAIGALAHLTGRDAAEGFAAASRVGRAALRPIATYLSAPQPHLRHGAALALCALRDEEGIESVCELLMTESAPIWREIAWALGQLGAFAVMPLVACVADYGPQGRDRAALALAHITAQGARRPVETLAGGRDPLVAAAARHALELVENLGPTTDGRRVEERAFTDVFFRAVHNDSAGYASAEASGPAMLLDDTDLVDADVDF